MTHPYGMRVPPPPCWWSQGSSHLLQSESSPSSPAHPLLVNCKSYDSARLEIFSPSSGVWESAEFPKAGCLRLFWRHRTSWKHHTSQFSPFLKPQRFPLESVRPSGSLDTRKPEKGLAAIPRPFLLGSYNKAATFPACLLRSGGKVLCTHLSSVGHWPS